MDKSPQMLHPRINITSICDIQYPHKLLAVLRPAEEVEESVSF